MPPSSSFLHGRMSDIDIRFFTLSNALETEVKVSELGAQLMSFSILNPDKKRVELLLGHKSFHDWAHNTDYYLGAVCGRFANRIANGRFTLEGQTYQLATNNAPGNLPCHLHGGVRGFQSRIWKGEPFMDDQGSGVRLTYHSSEGEEGYPGALDVTVTYHLNDTNTLRWEVRAMSTAPTPINIVNHAYWNLSGDFNQTINEHILQLNASSFLPTNEGMIPTGEIRSVQGTPLDFLKPQALGKEIDNPYPAIHNAAGYDHCFVLANAQKAPLQRTLDSIATLTDPHSKRSLLIATNQPGVQLYTGNFLNTPFLRRSGVCLETQAFPDAPNHPHFPSSILTPTQTYNHTTTYTII